MNNKQKLVQEKFIGNEEDIIWYLDQIYTRALRDVNDKIDKQMKRFDPITGDLPQSAVYQVKYQKMIKDQLEDILETLQTNEYTTISEYLDECYNDGFIGAVYDLHGQGIPLVMPINQEAVIRAVQLDSKISQGLYTKLGENIGMLKRRITAEVSRSIATGTSYANTAKHLAAKTNIGYNNAIRIARTEGHRIQTTAAMDALENAKDRGADVVKQWDSTLDKRTRESHQHVDGEIRELDEPFSNGLMFPGDPDGAAAEVINCRCALLQRARWALDDDELEQLKQRAAYFGLDKSKNFDDFKAKYLKAVEPPKQTPKKQYLTTKKLEDNIATGKNQLTAAEKQFKMFSHGMSYDDIIDKYGSLDSFAQGMQLQKLKFTKKQIDGLKSQVDDWEDQLNKKLIASKKKKLKKEQILLQDQLDAYDIKPYSNIWKDDVTVKDWMAKKDAIPKKKKYFEQQLLYATDTDEMNKWKDLYLLTDEFDQDGAAYYKIKNDLDKVTAELKNLGKGGKITPKVPGAAFTQDRKDAALWAKSVKQADDKIRDVSGNVWQKSSSTERFAIYDYTRGSGKFNRPLAGFEKPYAEWGTGWEPKWNKGVGNVWIDYEGAGDEIRHMTNMISESSYDFDMWLQHGCQPSTIESFLGLAPNTFENMSHDELQQFVGRSNRRHSFMSCGVSKGSGFSSSPVIVNVYAPEGTNMMYAEPFSAFGQGGGLNWDGVQKQSSFGYEAEMIIQRGASYEITKIEKASNGMIYIDMDVHPEDGYDLIQQDPSEWKGSTKKGR